MMDVTSCLAVFDVSFHWLQLCVDYENVSTQRHHSGLNTDKFKEVDGVGTGFRKSQFY